MRKMYMHIKTGNIYYIMCEAIDCTNVRSTNQTIMVVYECPTQFPDMIFTREKKEFLKKFKLIERIEVDIFKS